MKVHSPRKCPICKKIKPVQLYWEDYWCLDCIDEAKRRIRAAELPDAPAEAVAGQVDGQDNEPVTEIDHG